MATNQTITWKDSVYAQNLEDAATEMNWTATVPDPAFVPTEANPTAPMIPNPVSKEKNFKKWIKAKAANMRIEQANRRALATVATEVDV